MRKYYSPFDVRQAPLMGPYGGHVRGLTLGADRLFSAAAMAQDKDSSKSAAPKKAAPAAKPAAKAAKPPKAAKPADGAEASAKAKGKATPSVTDPALACRVEKCKQPVRAKGYCRKHFIAWRRGEAGDHHRYKVCSKEGCRKPRTRGGLCDEHAGVGAPAAEGAAPAA